MSIELSLVLDVVVSVWLVLVFSSSAAQSVPSPVSSLARSESLYVRLKIKSQAN